MGNSQSNNHQQPTSLSALNEANKQAVQDFHNRMQKAFQQQNNQNSSTIEPVLRNDTITNNTTNINNNSNNLNNTANQFKKNPVMMTPPPYHPPTGTTPMYNPNALPIPANPLVNQPQQLINYQNPQQQQHYYQQTNNPYTRGYGFYGYFQGDAKRTKIFWGGFACLFLGLLWHERVYKRRNRRF
eukprot:UN00760